MRNLFGHGEPWETRILDLCVVCWGIERKRAKRVRTKREKVTGKSVIG